MTILHILIGNRDGERQALADALAESVARMRRMFREELAALPPVERAEIIRGLDDTPPVLFEPPPPLRPVTPRR